MLVISEFFRKFAVKKVLYIFRIEGSERGPNNFIFIFIPFHIRVMGAEKWCQGKLNFWDILTKIGVQ